MIGNQLVGVVICRTCYAYQSSISASVSPKIVTGEFGNLDNRHNSHHPSIPNAQNSTFAISGGADGQVKTSRARAQRPKSVHSLLQFLVITIENVNSFGLLKGRLISFLNQIIVLVWALQVGAVSCLFSYVCCMLSLNCGLFFTVFSMKCPRWKPISLWNNKQVQQLSIRLNDNSNIH